ncbi:MAG TPA: GNAT family N-acetyltransferase [Tepidisphaeraceae bacterium]|jgi:ribosomal protein S18 acetylase RimI-like enzyme
MSNRSAKVRRGELRDLETIVDFNSRMATETEHLALDRATLTDGVRAALVDENKGIYFVAELDGRVVGQLMITHEWSDWRNGDIWWIQSVYVHPDYRKGGVFRSIFTEVEASARAAGAVGVRLYVEKENHSAQQTYERLGMKITDYLIAEKMLSPATS